MLAVKVEHAALIRCLSEDGRRELLNIVGNTYQEKVKVLHMGVRVPETLPWRPVQVRSKFVIACSANLVPTKGHKFLIEACALLAQRGIRGFQCLIIGDGPLQEKIRDQISKLDLGMVVKLVGRLPHAALMEMYQRGEVDMVVLPSIMTPQGEKEGIPVALMEAMAYGIPVIATDTGGIPELLSNSAGIMVEEKRADHLADAMKRLMEDHGLRKEFGFKGYEKVKEQFDIRKNVERLLELMKH